MMAASYLRKSLWKPRSPKRLGVCVQSCSQLISFSREGLGLLRAPVLAIPKKLAA